VGDEAEAEEVEQANRAMVLVDNDDENGEIEGKEGGGREYGNQTDALDGLSLWAEIYTGEAGNLSR